MLFIMCCAFSISDSSIPLSVPYSDHLLVLQLYAKYLKRWSDEGTDSGIEESDMLLAQHNVGFKIFAQKSRNLCFRGVGFGD